MKNLDIFERAQEHTSNNKDELMLSKFCACVYCGRTGIDPATIEKWVDVDGSTGICPHCGIDSLIGSLAAFPLTNVKFMKALHDDWFSVENAVDAKDLKRQEEEVTALIEKAARRIGADNDDTARVILLVKGKALDFPIVNMAVEEVKDGLERLQILAYVIERIRVAAGLV